MRERILAKAVVDVEKSATPIALGKYRVEVWGAFEPYDYVRIYAIQAKSEDQAAREGIDRFVEEIGVLLSKEGT
jgi:hypothetical protein